MGLFGIGGKNKSTPDGIVVTDGSGKRVEGGLAGVESHLKAQTTAANNTAPAIQPTTAPVSTPAQTEADDKLAASAAQMLSDKSGATIRACHGNRNILIPLALDKSEDAHLLKALKACALTAKTAIMEGPPPPGWVVTPGTLRKAFPGIASLDDNTVTDAIRTRADFELTVGTKLSDGNYLITYLPENASCDVFLGPGFPAAEKGAAVKAVRVFHFKKDVLEPAVGKYLEEQETAAEAAQEAAEAAARAKTSTTITKSPAGSADSSSTPGSGSAATTAVTAAVGTTASAANAIPLADAPATADDTLAQLRKAYESTYGPGVTVTQANADGQEGYTIFLPKTAAAKALLPTSVVTSLVPPVSKQPADAYKAPPIASKAPIIPTRPQDPIKANKDRLRSIFGKNNKETTIVYHIPNNGNGRYEIYACALTTAELIDDEKDRIIREEKDKITKAIEQEYANPTHHQIAQLTGEKYEEVDKQLKINKPKMKERIQAGINQKIDERINDIARSNVNAMSPVKRAEKMKAAVAQKFTANNLSALKDCVPEETTLVQWKVSGDAIVGLAPPPRPGIKASFLMWFGEGGGQKKQHLVDRLKADPAHFEVTEVGNNMYIFNGVSMNTRPADVGVTSEPVIIPLVKITIPEKLMPAVPAADIGAAAAR